MNANRIIGTALQWLGIDPYVTLDGVYVPLDREKIRRTRNLRLIPTVRRRRGGRKSYAEWAYVIGIFQTLISFNLKNKEDNRILDVGCGTGVLAIAAEPFVERNGKYIGIDVIKDYVVFCRDWYPSERFEFIHMDATNPVYAPTQASTESTWPIDSASIDLGTASALWSNLAEKDAIFYFTELARVLKPRARAIVTLFLLDELYEQGIHARSAVEGRYHTTLQTNWIFDQSAYGSDVWRHAKWATPPEEAIGITPAGVERLVSASGLKVIEHHQGTWKEVPGLLFQDVLIFEKSP